MLGTCSVQEPFWAASLRLALSAPRRWVGNPRGSQGTLSEKLNSWLKGGGKTVRYLEVSQKDTTSAFLGINQESGGKILDCPLKSRSQGKGDGAHWSQPLGLENPRATRGPSELHPKNGGARMCVGVAALAPSWFTDSLSVGPFWFLLVAKYFLKVLYPSRAGPPFLSAWSLPSMFT